jgi:hypothetical protein
MCPCPCLCLSRQFCPSPAERSFRALFQLSKVDSFEILDFDDRVVFLFAQAVDEMDVSAYDARKMIEAAVTTQESIEQESITFEEFKKMIMWTPEDEENL